MSSLFLRVFQHLLPTGQAWRTTIDKTLRRLFEGLSSSPQDVVNFADAVFGDAFPSTTRELAEWEKQFGIVPNVDDATRRLNLAAEWASTGGQSIAYIQGVLQAAGFTVYIYDSYDPTPPYTVHDPHAYTTAPLIGSYQCYGTRGHDQPACAGLDSDGAPLLNQPECNAFLANDPHYIVNKDLTPRPPPPIPSDPSTWPYFMYVGGSTFGAHATVPASRRGEFERLLLKLRPTQLWIVTLIDYSPSGGAGSGIFDDSFSAEFQ
jgi:hypothetical protein